MDIYTGREIDKDEWMYFFFFHWFHFRCRSGGFRCRQRIYLDRMEKEIGHTVDKLCQRKRVFTLPLRYVCAPFTQELCVQFRAIRKIPLCTTQCGTSQAVLHHFKVSWCYFPLSFNNPALNTASDTMESVQYLLFKDLFVTCVVIKLVGHWCKAPTHLGKPGYWEIIFSSYVNKLNFKK